ncbi:MAG: response regulator [Planctomycetota bacterium]
MKKVKLLLVDDEAEFVETLQARLALRDLDARVARDGAEALSAVETEEPDVIVLDLKMPGIDGIEVLRRVKQAYPNVEVIILTGHGSKQDEETARSLGAFQYMQKPVDLDKLVPQISGAWKRRMRKLQSMSMAVAFAEEGEFDTALDVMEDADETEKTDDQKKNDQGT